MRRRIGAVLATLAVALALPASAQAIVIVGTLDQQQTVQTDNKYWGDGYVLAQTFTAGMTGTLDSVTFTLGSAAPAAADPAAAGDFTVAIWPTSSGVPTGGSPLASAADTFGSGGLYVVTFSSPASVVSGTQYALELVPDTGTIQDWLQNCETDAYAGGQALVFDTNNDPQWRSVVYWGNNNDTGAACALDFVFATYVTPGNATPPPTSAASLPSGDSRDSALPLLFVAFAIAAAFVTVRRVATITR